MERLARSLIVRLGDGGKRCVHISGRVQDSTEREGDRPKRSDRGALGMSERLARWQVRHIPTVEPSIRVVQGDKGRGRGRATQL